MCRQIRRGSVGSPFSCAQRLRGSARALAPWFDERLRAEIGQWSLWGISYRFADGLALAVFARNLLNANYIENVTMQAANSGLNLATRSDRLPMGSRCNFGTE